MPVVIAAIIGLLAACSAGRGEGGPASLAVARQQLVAHTRGMTSVVVRVPDGYEAATYDQHGHIGFWTDTGSWHKVAERNYPRIPGAASTSRCGRPGVAVTGALLPESRHATYIACGLFSGDGSGWDIVFTSGARGWRYLVPQGRELTPTGSSATYANSVFFSARFVGRTLQTGVDTGVFNSAFASAFPLMQDWRWKGTGFKLMDDSSFKARAVAAPTISAPALPTTLPGAGTYGVAIRRMDIKPAARTGLEADITMSIEPEVIHGPLPYDTSLPPSGPTQSLDVAANTKVLLPFSRAQGISYITAPAWYIAGLALSNGNGINIEPLLEDSPAFFSKPGLMPWYIPATLRVTGFALGSDSFTAVAKPASAEITFRNGSIAQIAIALY